MIHITRSNVIFMWSVVDLPMYAAPLDSSAADHWRTPPPATRVNTWVPYGRIVSRDHPWIDRGEQKLFDLRQAYHRCHVRVTDINASISLRVALPVDELTSSLTRIAGHGPIDMGECRLSLDSTTVRDGDSGTTAMIDGSMSMPWMFGRLEVIAATRPWSSTRADLVLTPTGRHRLRYPRRWFSVGFTLADELRRRLTT